MSRGRFRNESAGRAWQRMLSGRRLDLLGGGVKRKRRETPVKDRAAKLDVPPTPDGVRDARAVEALYIRVKHFLYL